MDSYKVLNITEDASDKEIEIAYMDLKRKYDPNFNTSIYSYKKYREVLKAYENIKDEQRRKMYSLKDNNTLVKKDSTNYELYDFSKIKLEESTTIDVEIVDYESETMAKSIDVNISYLYYLLNLKANVNFKKRVKCKECSDFKICDVCGGDKVIEKNGKVVACPKCFGTGKVSSNCSKCEDEGFHLVDVSKDIIVDSPVVVLKGEGDETIDNKGDLNINFIFYDKDNFIVKDDVIEIKYYLNKKQTFEGIKEDYFSENGCFKLEVNPFVENGYQQEILFSEKKIIYTFYNERIDGENKIKHLFINEKCKNEILYFNNDYSSFKDIKEYDFTNEVKIDEIIVVEGKGNKGLYGGKDGDLVIETIFSKRKETVYMDDIKDVLTSKMFNLLGGKIGDIYHYGFKGKNALIKRVDVYYLLKGNSSKKNKLKNYFVFKLISIVGWLLTPCLYFFLPYSKDFYLILLITFVAYFGVINLLMEVEV